MAALIVAVVALGVLKPWGAGPQLITAPITAARPSAATAASPAPVAVTVASAAPARDDSGPCSWGMAWRLYTAESSDVGPVRTWYGIQPLEASGPTDPRIEVVRIHSASVGQLGYCSVSRPAPIHILGTQAWRLVPGGNAQPVLLAPALGADESDPDAGVIYAPPSAGAWPAATYVFGVHLATTPWSEEWFAVQIL
ncbi:MAG TPA: hypothetical protein VGJ17_04375 [Candidatus Limnocylindrales bacterium]